MINLEGVYTPLAFALGYTLTLFITGYTGRHFGGGECARKLLHVVAGCLALVQFQVLEYRWQHLAVGLAGLPILLMVRRRFPGFIRFNLERTTWGDLYFVAGISIPLLLSSPGSSAGRATLLVLTFSDTAAAIFAGRKNTTVWKVLGKTIQGSGAFLLVTLALLYGVYRNSPEALGHIPNLLALSLAVTLCEAASLGGIDNLTIPASLFPLLSVLSSPPLVFSAFITAVCTASLSIIRWRYRHGKITPSV